MQKWLLGALVAALLIAGVLLWWQTRAESPAKQSAGVAKAATAAEDADKSPTRAALPRPNAPKTAESKADKPQWDPLAEETTASHLASLRLGGDVPQRIMAAAGGCYMGEKGRYEKMEIKYTIRYRDGTGTILDTELVSTEINDPRLEKCVVETVRGLTWSDPAAPDFEDEQTDAISILALQKRAPDKYRPKKYRMGADSGDDDDDDDDE